MSTNLKRFLIHCSTAWCGMDNTFRAIANNEEDLYDLAEELAYDNFESYDLWEEVAKEEGYDPETMTEEEWDILRDETDKFNYYGYNIEEFTGSEEEWEDYGGILYE